MSGERAGASVRDPSSRLTLQANAGYSGGRSGGLQAAGVFRFRRGWSSGSSPGNDSPLWRHKPAVDKPELGLDVLHYYVVKFCFWVCSMLNNAFPQQRAFGPEATAAMGEAFDAACEELRFASQPEVIRELIARVIIAAANRGELDPIRLRKAALAGFTIFRPHGLPASAIAEPSIAIST